MISSHTISLAQVCHHKISDVLVDEVSWSQYSVRRMWRVKMAHQKVALSGFSSRSTQPSPGQFWLGKRSSFWNITQQLPMHCRWPTTKFGSQGCHRAMMSPPTSTGSLQQVRGDYSQGKNSGTKAAKPGNEAQGSSPGWRTDQESSFQKQAECQQCKCSKVGVGREEWWKAGVVLEKRKAFISLKFWCI